MCISKANLTQFAKGNLVRGCVKQTNKQIVSLPSGARSGIGEVEFVKRLNSVF